MPYCCVPGCKNGSRKKTPGIQFFRFPVSETESKKWMRLIRRTADFELGMETRICSWHFPNGKAKGPSRFAWNIGKSFDQFGINPDAGKPKRVPKKLNATEEVSTKTDLEAVVEALRKDLDSAQSKIIELEKSQVEINIALEEKTRLLSQAQAKILNMSVDIDMKNYQLKKLQSGLNLTQHFEAEAKRLENEKLTDSEHEKCEARNIEIDKPVPDLEVHLVFSEFDADTLAGFIGLRDISSLEFLVKMLEHKNSKAQKSSRILTISTHKQILLFLIKCKLDLPYRVMAKLFKISCFTVSNVFNSILNFIYELFYEGKGPLSKIPSRKKTSNSLPSSFADMPNCRIVLDCTEFAIDIPAKMKDKKVTYSNYKSKHTMKSLIGCAPNGTAVFVSDLYGGSESDKSIVIRSKLLQEMEPGDLILADKGFELHDILPPGVALNIPSFLMNRQFTLNETIRNRAYARARIIIERLNAKLKIFRILNCIKSSDRTKADRLVKVCVALTTLMPTLLDELNDE